jgi:hypothetical protein
MPIFVPPAPAVGLPVGPYIPGTISQKRYATLGGYLFGGVDQYGTKVLITDDNGGSSDSDGLKGWAGGVDTTGTITQRSADHGGWADVAYMVPRSIEIDLRLMGASFRHVSASIDALTAAVPLNELDELIVVDHGVALRALVRQAGEALFTQKGAQATGSILLTAPDPRRYDPSETILSANLPSTIGGLSLPITLPFSVAATVASGVLTATNSGNTNTRPTFVVSGPCPPFRIVLLATGATLSFAESLIAGQSLTIDTDTQAAQLDDGTYRTVTGSWFEYVPGDNNVAFQADSYDPDALLQSTHRSAWR